MGEPKKKQTLLFWLLLSHQNPKKSKLCYFGCPFHIRTQKKANFAILVAPFTSELKKKQTLLFWLPLSHQNPKKSKLCYFGCPLHIRTKKKANFAILVAPFTSEPQ